MHTPTLPDARGVSVGHVRGALLVGGRNKSNAGLGEDVQGVHIGGADDAEDVGDAVGDKSFHQRFAGSHLNGHDVRGSFRCFLGE